MQKATRQQTKEHNTSLVLRMIFEHASISRAEIARITSLTRTTVSDIVSELMAAGLVSEVGLGESIGGKSPILLSLVKNARYLIGVDLAYNQFRGAIVNLRGEIMEKVSLAIDAGCTGEKALASLYTILDNLVQKEYRPLVGIGVGTPGLVNTRQGIVLNAVNLDWQNLPLAQLLRERYGLPAYILNDSQAAALGELALQNPMPGEANLVVINVRRGLGSGIILNGNLFQGDGYGAGEIGHVAMVQQGGRRCRCGNIGCLETVASTRAVIERVREERGRQAPSGTSGQAPSSTSGQAEVTLDSLEEAFRAGDPLVCQVILEAGHYLGLAVSNYIGTLNIERIVLVGDLNRFGEPLLEAIRMAVSQTTLARLAQDTHVELGLGGENGIIRGASSFLLKDYSLLYR
jgi:N-acetylglucosamine repressor